MSPFTTKHLLIFAIFCQTIIIIVLFYRILYSNNPLSISINPIKSKHISQSSIDGFNNFYEPRASEVQDVPQQWLDYIPRYTINKDTLNERFDYDLIKGDKTFRIITMGDSFTYGQNVSTKDNWTELLEDYLNKNSTCAKVDKYEVINLGMAGYDTAYSVERFKLRGMKYDPDLVIWFVFDLHRITEKILNIEKQLKLDEKDFEKKGKYYVGWLEAGKKLLNQYGESKLVDIQLGWMKLFRDKFYKINPLLFISRWRQIESLNLKNSYYEDTLIFEDKANFLPDGHFNKKGHNKFMEETHNALIENKLLPCP